MGIDITPLYDADELTSDGLKWRAGASAPVRIQLSAGRGMPLGESEGPVGRVLTTSDVRAGDEIEIPATGAKYRVQQATANPLSVETILRLEVMVKGWRADDVLLALLDSEIAEDAELVAGATETPLRALLRTEERAIRIDFGEASDVPVAVIAGPLVPAPERGNVLRFKGHDWPIQHVEPRPEAGSYLLTLEY